MNAMETWRNELYHHGILGQKWGVRRYQNEDGTYTNLGKRRRTVGGVKPENLANAANVSKSSSNAARTASQMVDRASKRSRDKAQSKIDTSNMSNEDLQRAITRMNLERQYKSLTAENLTPGRDRASYILSVTGDVLAITASAATVAMAVSKIRSNRTMDQLSLF